MVQDLEDGVVRSPAILVGNAKNLTVRETRGDGVLVVDVNGSVNGANAEEFHRVVGDMVLDDDSRMVLDFGDLVYISSAGLRIVLLLSRRFLKIEGGPLRAVRSEGCSPGGLRDQRAR